MKIIQIKSPILPRNKKDPTQSSRVISRIFKDIDSRYKAVSATIFEKLSTYQVRQNNADSGQYVYSMTPAELASLFEFINSTLQDNVLEGGVDNLWMFDHLDDEFLRGTQFAFTNLSTQYQPYADTTNIRTITLSPGYQNQVAAARVSAWSEWKGVSDKGRANISSAIAEAVVNGTNVRDTAKVIQKKINASRSEAMNVAQTEQLGAYRQAARNEVRWSQERLGMNTAMMHLSALLPTSRPGHVARHGHIYTPDEIEEWYSQDGNRFRCHCTQVPVVLDDDGQLMNRGMVERLAKERQDWQPIAKKLKS